MDTIDLDTVVERWVSQGVKLPETQRFISVLKQIRSPLFKQINCGELFKTWFDISTVWNLMLIAITR